MGRTLVGILTIGAAIAVNVIPGVGQVLSGAIVGTLGGTFAALGVAQAVVGAITLGVTVAGIQSLGGLLGLGPTAPKADTAATSIKTSRPPRYAGYGEMRLYGAYVLYETGSNGAAVDGYAVHDGMMTAPVAFYLGDDKVTHKPGVTYPGGLINSLSDGRYGDDTTRFYWTDGRTPGTTIPVIVGDLPGVWTPNHRGDGVCLIYARFASVKSKNFLERYPSGVPTASIAAQWQKCPDPWASDPCDDSAWTWTENPIRQTMHYILYREAPVPTIPEDDPAYYDEMMALRVAYFNRKIAPSIATWRAASDVCNEAVALKAGGTEARYRSCLSHSLVSRHGEVKAGLLSLCDGWMATQADGSIAVYAGKYYAPTVSIGPDHIIAYEWEGVGVDDDAAVNEIVCSYVSKAHDYNSVECDAWRDEDDISARGSLLSDTLDMQTPSWGQVRRLAKRKMARTNATYRGTITTNIAGRIARGHRYINLLIREAGATFYDGPVEITAVTRNVATGGVTFSWVAADPNIDAWNPATEEGEPAALGDRVATLPLDAPAITDATPQFADDGVSVQILINVVAPDRDDLTWFARWKLSSDAVWNEQAYSDIDAGAAVQLLIGQVPTEATIDVAVAYQVGDGRVSPWSASESVDTSTAGVAPGAPTLLTLVSSTVDTVTLSARAPTNANFQYMKFFAGTTNVFGASVAITSSLVDAPGAIRQITEFTVPAGARYYWAVAYSSSDVASTPTGPLSVNVGAFDFSGSALPAGATLTRAGSAWYRNSSGVLTLATTDVARLGYRYNTTSSAWERGGLLVEPAATNLVLQSQNIATTWTKTAVTTPAASQLIETTAPSTGHFVAQNVNVVSGQAYVLSAEGAEISGSAKRYLTLHAPGTIFGAVRGAKFDLATGTITFMSAGTTATIAAAGPGRWLCSIYVTATSSGAATLNVRLSDVPATSSTPTYTGDGSSGLDITNLQIEAGTKRTSSIVTTTAAVTRPTDVVSLDWATNRHVPDGAITARYTFDDGTTQDVSTTVVGGHSTVPTNLNRAFIKKVERV